MIGAAIRQRSNWIVLSGIILLLSGCFGGNVPKVTYFSLLNMEQLGEVHAVASLAETKLGIGPITIPDSLKRSQIVTRQHDNQYAFSEFNRWVGVMEKDLGFVLGDNFGKLLGIEKVGFFPWMHHFEPTYRVAIDVVRLDGALGDEAVLSARWTVADAEGKTMLVSGKSDYRQPLEDASYAALIKAESQVVAELSKEIAMEIAALVK